MRRAARGFVLIGALALALGPTRPAAAATAPRGRDGWLLGVGVGGGSLALRVPGVPTEREGGGAASLRIGYAVSSQLSLELAGTIWSKAEFDRMVSYSVSGPAVSFAPGGKGLVLRMGAGLGTGEATQRIGFDVFTGTQSGLGIMGGIGYEFRVRPGWALGPELHAARIHLDGFDADWINLVVGIHWYTPKHEPPPRGR